MAIGRLRVWRGPAYVVAGLGIWLAMHESGIHPTIAGLAMGLATSAFLPARADLEEVTARAREFREQPTPELARSARLGLESAVSPNERLQLMLHPWTSFVIVPLFALANAGITLDSDLLRDAADVTRDARHPRRLRRRQAAGHPRGVVAGDAPRACACRSAGERCSAAAPSRASASPSRC